MADATRGPRADYKTGPSAPACRYHVRAADVPAYAPSGHGGTLNQRLIALENVGARRMEVVLGTAQPGGGSVPHVHADMEQACYLLEGTARAQVDGQSFDMVAGDMCFFPAGSSHNMVTTGDSPAKVLVIYSPPQAVTPA